MKLIVLYFRNFLFSLLLLQTTNIAFDPVSTVNLAWNVTHHSALEYLTGDPCFPVQKDCQAENGESCPENELLPENLETGSELPEDLVSLFAFSVKWELNRSFSGYKNHVAELYSRPPKAV